MLKLKLDKILKMKDPIQGFQNKQCKQYKVISMMIVIYCMYIKQFLIALYPKLSTVKPVYQDHLGTRDGWSLSAGGLYI